jgi:hypothetical protein
MRGGWVRGGLPVFLAAALLAAVLAACGSGGGGDTSATVTDTGAATKPSVSTISQSEGNEADAKLLNELLTRQSAAVEAVGSVLSHLHGQGHAAALLFRGQEQEHVDGMLKELRILSEPAEPGEETIEAGELKAEADALEFLYELESATIEAEVSAITKLESPSARALLTSIVANQGQHLLILRRLLGSKLLDSVPSAFENGTESVP